MLSDSDSESSSSSRSSSNSNSDKNDIHQLSINAHYAKAFQIRKEREELANLKDKYGSASASDNDDDEEGSETDYSTEDSTGFDLTPAVDAAILRTLARIKKKDPEIYQNGVGVFDEERQKVGNADLNVDATTRKKNSSKTKPLLMKQHILNSTLNPASRSPSPQPEDPNSKKINLKTHVEEQEELRKEVVSAFHSNSNIKVGRNTGNGDGDNDSDASDDDDDLLIPRMKTKDEIEEEEEAYRKFLEREVGKDLVGLVSVDDPRDDDVGATSEIGREEDVKVQKKKQNKNKKRGMDGTKSKQVEDNEFLMNYILNRGWIDKSARHVPTYSEITGVEKRKKSKVNSEEKVEENEENESEDDEDEDDFDEEDFDEIADTFESSYNFRFEEPDASTITSHPRTLTSTVRRIDTKRKDARERKKERKEEKMMKKREEVRRMKALKMKEVLRRLERIGKEGGVGLDEEALKELDLDADWDPEEHDKQMKAIYDDNDPDNQDEEVNTGKPIWNDDIDISDIVPSAQNEAKKKKKKKKDKKKGRDDDDEGMGVDLDDMDADVVDSKRQGQEVDEEEWDGTEEMRKRKLDEYMDDLYGMEFNDMVGDLPTRFKYTPVASQTYGLSAVDILLADDKDLNEFRGIKKYAPYRAEREDGRGKVKWEKLKEVKEKVRVKAKESGIGDEVLRGPVNVKKRKGKKERMKAKTDTQVEGDIGDDLEETEPVKRRKHN